MTAAMALVVPPPSRPVLAPPLAPVLAPGVTVRVKITLHYPPRLQQPDAVLICKGEFANGKGRLDIDSIGGKASFSVGDYMLILDSAQTMLVRPKGRTYYEISSPLENQLESLVNGLGGKVVVREAKVGFDELGPGEEMQGFQTDHYRIFMDYTLDIAGPHGTQHETTHQSSEMWVAKLGLNIASPFAGHVQPDLTIDDASRDVHRQLAALNEKLGDGVALKRVVRTTLVLGSGSGMDYIQTVELSDVRQTEIDEARLKLPADYNKKGGTP